MCSPVCRQGTIFTQLTAALQWLTPQHALHCTQLLSSLAAGMGPPGKKAARTGTLQICRRWCKHTCLCTPQPCVAGPRNGAQDGSTSSLVLYTSRAERALSRCSMGLLAQNPRRGRNKGLVLPPNLSAGIEHLG